MDETERLKAIIMSFRVQDLQALLAFAQRNKSGNKSELQKRAITLIQKPQPSIAAKINEIHRNTNVKTKSISIASYSREHAELVNIANNLSEPEKYMQELQFCSLATNFLNEVRGMEKPINTFAGPLGNFPIQPDVRFKKLPFCQVLSELLKTSTLIPVSDARMQVAHFDFHLTPQQGQDILSNRKQKDRKCEFSIQVQLRIGLLETSCEQKDSFPPHLGVRVNNRMLQLPIQVNNTRFALSEKYFASPLDITTMLRLSPTATNTLTLEWLAEYGRNYVARVTLIRRLSADDLLRQLRARGYKPADYTRGLIKEKLAIDDVEISCSSWRVSVCCPLSKSRMSEPCRPAGCRHLQCFDAPTYLRMNECKETWVCPICDKPAPYEELALDGYFSDVINSPRLNKSNELFINGDGSWYQTAENIKVQKEQDDDVELIILDDSDVQNESKMKREGECISDSPVLPAPAAIEIVDLTISDSSDEDDIPLSVLARSIRRTETDIEMEPSDVSRKSSVGSIVMVD